jgi:hypothetical protein
MESPVLSGLLAFAIVCSGLVACSATSGEDARAGTTASAATTGTIPHVTCTGNEGVGPASRQVQVKTNVAKRTLEIVRSEAPLSPGWSGADSYPITSVGWTDGGSQTFQMFATQDNGNASDGANFYVHRQPDPDGNNAGSVSFWTTWRGDGSGPGVSEEGPAISLRCAPCKGGPGCDPDGCPIIIGHF